MPILSKTSTNDVIINPPSISEILDKNVKELQESGFKVLSANYKVIDDKVEFLISVEIDKETYESYLRRRT